MPDHLAAPLDAALDLERRRLHAQNASTMLAATMLAVSVLVAIGWGRADPAPLVGGWLAVVLALAVRWAVIVRQRRSPDVGDPAGWLWRHRLAIALHGAAWGGLALAVLPSADAGMRQVVVFAVSAMVGGSLVSVAFDRRASAAFAVLALVGLTVRLLAMGEPWLAVMALAFAVGMLLVSRRASDQFVRQVQAAQAEARRVHEVQRAAQEAESARRALGDQHALLRQLIDGTEQGYWFIGPDGRTLDVNPAMCRLLGRSREQLLGLSVFDCFDGPEREELQRQLERRRRGEKGGYALDIVRPDGSRLHTFNNATPIFAADGTRLGSIGLWTDLTPMRRLQAELRTYERVTQSIDDLVAVVDDERRLVLVNDAWCGAAGVKREQVLGRQVALHPVQLDPSDPMSAVERCLADGSRQTVTVDARAPDGSRRRLLTTFVPYRGDADPDARGLTSTVTTPDGAPVRAVILVSRNVTHEHRALEQLRHREAELRGLFEAFPGFVSAVDDAMRYVYTNARTAAMLGRAGEDLAGRTLDDVLSPDLLPRVRAEFERAAAGEVVLVERQLPATAQRAGMVIDITHVAGPPDPAGRRITYSFGLDVTARKQALDALGRARDDAERANRAKSRFLSHMSHELRTPLNAISGFAQLLERDRRAALPPHQRNWVGQILRGGQHLSQLIGEVLDLARIESGQLALELQAVALPDLADECLAFVRELATTRDVRVRPSSWPGSCVLRVQADRVRLKQVLLNLLSNAIKYNRAGGDVTLGADDAGARLRIWVRDTGPGLTDEQRARLFQPFERLGAERGTIEGTGIGLLVSRHLVEAMGGVMGVDSTPGQGSLFWLELPRASSADAQPSTVPTRDGPPTRSDAGDTEPPAPGSDVPASVRPVLCVDDNPVNLMLLQTMLDEACGLPAVAIESPALAPAAARRLQPWLVLLDIHMPGMDGYQVLKQLRADPQTAELPVVAVSADAHAHEIETARAAGFDGYLTKPIELDDLRAVIDRVRRTCGVAAP